MEKITSKVTKEDLKNRVKELGRLLKREEKKTEELETEASKWKGLRNNLANAYEKLQEEFAELRKENVELKKRMLELESQHKEDIDKISELSRELDREKEIVDVLLRHID